MEELLSALQSNGFSIPNIQLDSKMKRFNRDGKNNGWFVGFENKTKKGDSYIVAVYGDWKTGEKYEYRTERNYTKDQERDISKRLKVCQVNLEREREELQKNAKREANDKWNDAGANSRVEYLTRKSVPLLFGCRSQLGEHGRNLLVPMRDCDGELWGVQTIYPDGSKYFLTGQRIKGLFHIVCSDEQRNSLENIETIYICEGFSTGASIHQAIGFPVFVAFNAANLVDVAKELKNKYPTATFVICGDDDRFTTRDDQPYNPGRDKAEEAASVCCGAAIFPKFASLEALPTDFNDLHLMEGLQVIKEQLLGAPDIDKKYILCLGFNEDKYFYTTSQNKYIKALSVGKHSKVELLSLMDLGYWESIYPAKNIDGVDWTFAIDDLMSKCRKKGPFNLNNVRATGAWLGDKKELVLNRGDSIITNGETKGFHSLKSRYIYEPGDLILPEPTIDCLDDNDCLDFLHTLTMLRWAHKDYYKFLAGWLMIAPICGALEWRPHIWLSGPSGSGKSTIMTEVIHKILRRTALFYQGQTTEAGIRQSLGKKSLPVVFDEFETNDEKSGVRIGQIVELFRQASFETDAYIVKGSADGQSINYLPRFMGLVSSVNVNLTFEADKNRFTVIELMRQEGDPLKSAEHFKTIQKRLEVITDEWVHGFYSRIFTHWDVFQHNKALLFDVISKKYNARFGQQYSALLAGYVLCEQSKPICENHAEFIVDTTDLDAKSKETDETDEKECLRYLLNKKVFINGSISQDVTIGQVICNANKAHKNSGVWGHRDDWHNALKLYGMLLRNGNLFIANNYGELNALYKGTKWSGIYDRSLKRVPGADNNENKPIWLHGASSKCTKIPLDAVLITDITEGDS